MAKEQWEEEAKDRFIMALRETTGVSYQTDAEDVPVEGGKNFDYRLLSTDDMTSPIALELFRLTPSKAELAQNSVWIGIVRQLKRELHSKGTKGYLVHTPHFDVPKVRRATFARELAERISQAIAARPEAPQFEQDGCKFTRIPSLGSIEFTSMGIGGAFDPTSIATECLQNKIGYKNEQLNVRGCVRTILIVNWNPLVDSGSVLLACSRFNFSALSNIDRVYFEASEGNLHLVFDRSIYGAVEAGDVEAGQSEETLYLQLIEARLADHDLKAFSLVKKITKERKSLEWLGADAHGSLALIAEDLLKKDDLDGALWIVRHLRDTAHPNIKALLCWPLQKLIVKNRPEIYPEILDILEIYAGDDDESVRAHVPIPLAELAARRRSKNNDGTEFMPAEMGLRIRTLAFRMLPGATGYVAERLSWVFQNIRDLSDTEALDIIRTLLANADGEREYIAALMIYCAVYRERYFPELGNFDSEPLKQLLRDTLRQGREDMRGTLIWLISRELKGEMNIDDVLPYLEVVPEGAFDRHSFSQLYRIVGEQLKGGKAEVCDLLLEALRCERQYLLENPRDQVWHFDDFFDTVRLSTKCCSPETASAIIETLCSMADRLGVSAEYIRQLRA